MRGVMKVKLLNPNAFLPRYESAMASGLDLRASEDVVLNQGARAVVPTGISVELPVGHEAQVRPRSGLAAKAGVTVLNTPGTIDEDYRGEIKVVLVNHGPYTYLIKEGDRIAQLVVAPVTRVTVELAGELSETERGVGGFGSTGR